jgi:hypothetical protein
MTHHVSGRHAMRPIHIPVANASAAQKSGWRAGISRSSGRGAGPGGGKPVATLPRWAGDCEAAKFRGREGN